MGEKTETTDQGSAGSEITALDGASFEEGTELDGDQLSSNEGDDKAKTAKDASEGDQSSIKDGEGEGEGDGEGDGEGEGKAKTTEDLDKKTKEQKMEYALYKRQKKINEEKQKREALEQELKETRAKLYEATAPKRPVVPPLPEALDPNYDQLMATREQAIRDQVAYDNNVQKQQEAAQQQTAALARQRTAEIQQKEKSYEEKLVDFAIDKKSADKYDKVVAGSLGQRHSETAEYLLELEKGPLVVKFLATNPLELDKVSAMTPTQAAAYIATDILPQTGNLAPSKSKTPAPTKVLEGKSGKPPKHPALEGATFS